LSDSFVGASWVKHDVRDLVSRLAFYISLACGHHELELLPALDRMFGGAQLTVLGEQVHVLGRNAGVDVLRKGVDQHLAGELSADLRGGGFGPR